MNLKELIDQFDLITDTEEGLDQLRTVILKQAVRGNLTKQDPNDEPAEKLLERIDEEKQRLHDEGEIRKPKDIPEVESPDFSLPLNWEWCRLGDLMTFTNGYAFKSSAFTDEGIGVVKIGDLQNGSVTETNMNYISPTIKEDIGDKYDVLPGDMMIAMSGATTGKLAFNNTEKTYLLNQRVGIIRPYFASKYYLYHYLNTKIEENLKKSSGSAIPNLSTKQIREIKLPLPPLEEQQRIVKKIGTLFSQVDELEQKVQQDREVDECLQVAMLDDLQRAETPEASKQSWQRLTNHFEQIYRKPEHIDQLKQAILNEAVRGRLVPQDPNDKPAEKLLERIKEEKQRLYEEGEIRKPSTIDPINEKSIPYEIPESWHWCNLGDIILEIYGGSTPSKNNPRYWGGNIFWASVKDLKDDTIYLESTQDKITEEGLKKTKLVPAGNVIVCTRMGLGKINLNTVDTTINQDLKSIILSPNLSKLYFYYYYKSLDIKGSGMTVSGIKQSELLRLPFALPSKEEQIRIINRIKELYTWCEDLKDKLSRSQQTDQRLLEALVNGEE